MDLIGKNDLLDLDILLPQPLHQVGGLREGHVAVVVAMHEEHRRLPSRHGRHRRRIKRQLHRLFVVRRVFTQAAAQQGRPVMHAVKVHAGGKDI